MFPQHSDLRLTADCMCVISDLEADKGAKHPVFRNTLVGTLRLGHCASSRVEPLVSQS